MTARLPTGTVTFLFTDIEGSTRLVQALGTGGWVPLLERHHALVRAALAAHAGREVKTEGDAFFAVFTSAPEAVAAAAQAQRSLAAEPWPQGAPIRVRMGLHTGEGALSAAADYVGVDVHRGARVAAVAHGGQVVLSATTRTLVEAGLPPGLSIRDLGEHRLKDLTQPEHISQLVIEGLPAEFPPLRSLDRVPNNLPTQLTSFVGRDREVAEARRLLETTRLLTLTGPGGTGKTRLGLQLAAEVADAYPDGVCFVPLDAVFDPGLVPRTIAGVLDLPDTGAQPVLERVADALRERRSLLLLDNFEQVLPAAPVVGEILRRAPKVRVVVTSRAALHIAGEQEYPVPPLELPDPAHADSPEALTDYAAVALFVTRARTVKPDFALAAGNAAAVAEICARLDGLPLAIELAAARVKLLPPQAILGRLSSRLDLLAGGARDLPDRQRTLRGAIAWSYDLLEEPARRLLARFATFVGGADLAAVEAVCGDQEIGGEDLLEGLGGLVDQSLLRQDEVEGEPRFRMLATIREFAQECLDAREEGPGVRERHARYFAALAQEAATHFLGSEKRFWLDRMAREHDNLRAALNWAQGVPEPQLMLGIVGTTWRFWQMRGHLGEGLEWCRRALALPLDGVPVGTRIQALDAAAGLAYWQADTDSAGGFYEAALALRREIGDEPGIAEELYNLSMSWSVSSQAGRPPGATWADLGAERIAVLERAAGYARESLERYTALGDGYGMGLARWASANAAYYLQRTDEAAEHLTAALAIFESLQASFMQAWTEYTWGVLHFRLGDRVAARRSWSSALSTFAAADDVSGCVIVCDAFAWLAWAEGDRPRAMRLGGFTDTLQASSGTRIGSLQRQAESSFAPRSVLGDPVLAAAYQEGREMSVEQAVAFALEEAPAAASGATAPER